MSPFHHERADLPGPLPDVFPEYADHATLHPPPAAALTIHIIGTPVPQGSKVANRYGNGVRDANATRLRPWRAEVAAATADAITAHHWTTLDGPCHVDITFHHQRPATHYGTGRNAGTLKPTAPHWKHTAPDIDKLTRAILDALVTARAISDDGRVARLVVDDLYATDEPTGAHITITPLPQPTRDRLPSPKTHDTNREQGLF